MTTFLYPFEKKRIIVTVISDLVTDYRVHKVCQTLHENGYQVLLIGATKKRSLSLNHRDYQTFRLNMWFQRTAFFYAEYNIRLFFRLLQEKAHFYLGNDLDVMPSTMLVARLKRKPVVYDSHEYFLGMAGLEDKPIRRSVWKFIESRIFARLKYMYTVSDSVRNLYRKNYLKKLFVVRNLPMKNLHLPEMTEMEKSWIHSFEQKIPPGKHLLLLQGAGLHASRGVEELVFSMIFLDSAQFHLLIVGGGEVYDQLQNIIDQNQLSDKITLIPKVPFAVLSHFTKKAHLGISIDKANVLNHKYSLSNKFFEYLHADVPVLASRLIEQEKIVLEYEVGGFIENHNPEHIADRIKQIFANPDELACWKSNCARVRNELNWENESKIILDIFKQVEKDSVNH